MLLGMISCNQKEDIVSQAQTDNTCIEYSVIEENEISSADLFDSASKSLESIPGILGLDILNESFDKAEMSLEPVDTRAGLSPLFYKTVRITYTTKDEKKQGHQGIRSHRISALQEDGQSHAHQPRHSYGDSYGSYILYIG